MTFSAKKFKALDIFCGAGGASRGLQMAGFHVTGVDINPQPRYAGDVFIQADAMTYPLDGFDFIWASPPCLKFTSLKSMPNAKEHDDLLTPMRERLKATGCLYVIENVPGSPLNRGAIMLCGTMFGLGIPAVGAELRRHRWFESNFGMLAPECRHTMQVVGVYGGGGVHSGRPARRPHTVGVWGNAGGVSVWGNAGGVSVWGNAGGVSVRDGVQQFSTDERSVAMGIDWMSGKELSQAIPPAYSNWIAQQIPAPALSQREGRNA